MNMKPFSLSSNVHPSLFRKHSHNHYPINYRVIIQLAINTGDLRQVPRSSGLDKTR